MLAYCASNQAVWTIAQEHVDADATTMAPQLTAGI